MRRELLGLTGILLGGLACLDGVDAREHPAGVLLLWFGGLLLGMAMERAQ
jgi:hypothetical protein